MGWALVTFLSVCAAATVLKLSSSVDDSIWLSKLVLEEDAYSRRLIYGVYLISLTVITLLSYLLYVLGLELFVALGSTERVLTMSTSCVLMLFAVLYLRRMEESGEGSSKQVRLRAKVMNAFKISCIGSVDELLTYVTVLSTGEIHLGSLWIGTMIAGALIIYLVAAVIRLEFVTRVLRKVPVWTVIFALGLITCVYAWAWGEV